MQLDTADFSKLAEQDAKLKGIANALAYFDVDALKENHATITREALLCQIAKIALQSPDDTWSGRGNDLKRITHDAYLATLADILDVVEFQVNAYHSK